MKQTRSAATIVSAAILAVFAGAATAQTTIFADNFDRADNRNIDASLTGITDNTGSGLAADTVYSTPWLDPNNQPPTYGVQDGVAANGGGAQILGNRLQLAVGAGTSAAFVNHNFINPAILSAGGFSVSLDIAAVGQSGYQQGGAFALGMSAAEAASVGDAFNQGIGQNPAMPSMTGAFNDGSTIGANIPGLVASDFWLALRGNSSMAWGSSSGVISGAAALGSKTGTISANFMFSDFNAGSTVNYEVFFNGVSKGTGSFTWSGSNENYIGLDARDSSAVSLDNFVVSIPEPTTAVLGLLGVAGLFWRRRQN